MRTYRKQTPPVDNVVSPALPCQFPTERSAGKKASLRLSGIRLQGIDFVGPVSEIEKSSLLFPAGRDGAMIVPQEIAGRPFSGQKALVTGANSGIGKAVAIAMAEAGAAVAVNYVTGEEETRAVTETIARSLAADGNPALAASATELRHARTSISPIFFANGFVVASWLPHIPEVKERLGLGDLLLGTALFSVAVGSVLVLPFAGWSAGRFGSNRTTRAAALALCVLLPAAVWAPNLTTLVLALLAFGAANGMLDVSMNAQAVRVEDRYRRPILSFLHGLYSTGGLAGASLVALAAAIGIPASTQALGLATVLAPLVLAISRFLLRREARTTDAGPVLAWPSSALMGLGALASWR